MQWCNLILMISFGCLRGQPMIISFIYCFSLRQIVVIRQMIQYSESQNSFEGKETLSIKQQIRKQHNRTQNNCGMQNYFILNAIPQKIYTNTRILPSLFNGYHFWFRAILLFLSREGTLMIKACFISSLLHNVYVNVCTTLILHK